MEDSVDIVRDLLEAVGNIINESEQATEKLARLQALATKTTATLTGMPGGGNSDKEALLAKLADERASWARVLERYVLASDVVRDFIEGSPLTDREKTLMLERYLGAMAWPYVYREINRMEPKVSERTMYRMHNRAFDKLVEYYNSGGLNEENTMLIRTIVQR